MSVGTSQLDAITSPLTTADDGNTSVIEIESTFNPDSKTAGII
jgi:hypothetical protein